MPNFEASVFDDYYNIHVSRSNATTRGDYTFPYLTIAERCHYPFLRLRSVAVTKPSACGANALTHCANAAVHDISSLECYNTKQIYSCLNDVIFRFMNCWDIQPDFRTVGKSIFLSKLMCFYGISMVAYFCRHLSDLYVILSDLYSFV